MSDTITGTTIADRYKVTGFLRSGRMGDMYVARRIDDGRRVSVKILDPALFHNEEAVKRFSREAWVTQAIEHPASMQVLELGETEVGPYIVMEYVDGEHLSDVLAEDGALAPDRAARITARIAMALAAAHDAGVIHRDLAPTHVMLASQGDQRDIVKVTDFGLALLTGMDTQSDDEEQLTAVGVRIGMPTYMAPEYIRDYELDLRADIYGLGVMLFEMLTGQVPYAGRPYKVMDQHVHAPIPRPSEIAPEVPGWLDDLVGAMMTKDPNARVQSAAEVVRLIELGLSETLDALTYRSTTGSPAMPRAVAAASPPPHPLDPLIARHLLDVDRTPAGPAPDPSRLFVVERVSPKSIAATLGIRPGWRVHLPDDDGGTGLLSSALTLVVQRRYRLIPPNGEAPRMATTTGLPLGMQLLRSPQNIAQNFDPRAPEASALLDLWRQFRWSDLEHLARLTLLVSPRDTAPDAVPLAQRLAAGGPSRLDHPALVLYGAALYEAGRHAEGLRWIRDFESRHAVDWPPVYRAIATLYEGLHHLKQGHTDVAADRFDRAHRIAWLPRAEARFIEVRGTTPEQPWIGRQFPDYVLEDAEGGSPKRLGEICQALQPSELVTVVVMGGFRANRAFDAVMRRYTRFTLGLQTQGPSPLTQLHIVTAAPDRGDTHHTGEDAARAAGISMSVLHDHRAIVHRAVRPTTLPTVYLIDRRRICVHQGALTSCDLWNALATAAQN